MMHGIGVISLIKTVLYILSFLASNRILWYFDSPQTWQILLIMLLAYIALMKTLKKSLWKKNTISSQLQPQ